MESCPQSSPPGPQRVVYKARGGQWVLKVSNSSNANHSAAITEAADVEAAAALVDAHPDLRRGGRPFDSSASFLNASRRTCCLCFCGVSPH